MMKVNDKKETIAWKKRNKNWKRNKGRKKQYRKKAIKSARENLRRSQAMRAQRHPEINIITLNIRLMAPASYNKQMASRD